MGTLTDVSDAGVSGVHKRISWLLVGGLLLLRLPLLGGVAFIAATTPDWLDPLFQIGTYLLTAGLIWWERWSLADSHIDGLAIVIVILLKPAQTLILVWWGLTQSPLAFPHWGSLIIWATAIGLLLALWPARRKLPRAGAKSWRWFGIGAGIGIAMTLVLGYPMSLQVPTSELGYEPGLLWLLGRAIASFPYQLGYAAVDEEPLFRGFLWGHLRRLGWKDVWIWLFQTGLFMLGHIYYWGRLPISFWLIVPLGALVMGALAWRSRTIAASMAAHGAMNALGNTVGYVIATLRLG